MLCGHSAFRRNTSADTVSAILKEDPTELPPDRRVPPPLQRIVNRCLEKHPAARFQSTTDLAFALETLFTPSSEGTVVTAPLPRTRVGSARMRTIAAVVLAALSGAIAAGAGVYFSRAPSETPDVSGDPTVAAQCHDLGFRLSFAAPGHLRRMAAVWRSPPPVLMARSCYGSGRSTRSWPSRSPTRSTPLRRSGTRTAASSVFLQAPQTGSSRGSTRAADRLSRSATFLPRPRARRGAAPT